MGGCYGDQNFENDTQTNVWFKFELSASEGKNGEWLQHLLGTNKRLGHTDIALCKPKTNVHVAPTQNQHRDLYFGGEYSIQEEKQGLLLSTLITAVAINRLDNTNIFTHSIIVHQGHLANKHAYIFACQITNLYIIILRATTEIQKRKKKYYDSIK